MGNINECNFNPVADAKCLNLNSNESGSLGNVLGIAPCSSSNPTNDYIQRLYSEQNNLTGIRVAYKRTLFDTTKHDPIYGEQPHAPFEDEREINLMVNFIEDTSIFSPWGQRTETQMDVWIPFDEWLRIYGKNTQPYSGDIFSPLDLFCDDKSGKGQMWFEVTSQHSGDLLNNIALNGVVWKLFAKRHNFTFEPNDIPETNSEQIGASDFFGLLSGGDSDELNVLADKCQTADEVARTNFERPVSETIVDETGDKPKLKRLPNNKKASKKYIKKTNVYGGY